MFLRIESPLIVSSVQFFRPRFPVKFLDLFFLRLSGGTGMSSSFFVTEKEAISGDVKTPFEEVTSSTENEEPRQLSWWLFALIFLFFFNQKRGLLILVVLLLTS